MQLIFPLPHHMQRRLGIRIAGERRQRGKLLGFAPNQGNQASSLHDIRDASFGQGREGRVDVDGAYDLLVSLTRWNPAAGNDSRDVDDLLFEASSVEPVAAFKESFAMVAGDD